MKTTRYCLFLFILTACSGTENLEEPVVEAPVVIEEAINNGEEECPSIEPGTDDGIGGTGCSVD
ncbi:hypothetical protein [Ruegeria meonggei]|uniref:Uncharacterized protein n=1 Tax=Ruegeria meonggei TaxID=1446476 RepID=A0A1X6ZM19_9RHOB|nr:hypothetical protein [Ruegeria meonggei]SLN55654.1 hypothetical protein RUM8411_02705 [Ruegeria meonggei]